MGGLCHKLRIAFSVSCGTACMLSIALWVRSFSYWDDAALRIGSHLIQTISAEGRTITWLQLTTITWRFQLDTDPLSVHQSPPGHERHEWLSIGFFPSVTTIRVAHCVLVMTTGALAVIPWLPTRFSLRGLLLSTTVVALTVGTIIWADRL